MAERQGLLQGRRISRVQFYCLSLLELMDEIKAADEKDWQLRATLVMAGRIDAEDAFPELGQANVVNDDDAEIPDEVDKHGDAIGVIYDFSNASYDPKAVEEEMRQMAEAAAKASTTFEQPVFGEW